MSSTFTGKTTIHEALNAITLSDLAMRYSRYCWEFGWKKGKTEDLNNPNDPFMGGPQALIDNGITSLEGIDGKTIEITKLTRIRMKHLSYASLEQLGLSRFFLPGTNEKGETNHSNDGRDIVHQEYVPTYEENINNDEQHLMNNFLAAFAALDALFSFCCNSGTTVERLIEAIENVLAGNEEGRGIAKYLAASTRFGWVGRVCTTGDWKKSKDFIYHFMLVDNVAAIDGYVVDPVLRYLLVDLRNGSFVS